MFMDTPNTLLIATVGAFILGWLIGRVGAAIRSRSQARKRDPRDDRIRSLEAELRISTSESEKARESLEGLEDDVKEAREEIERRDNVITEQQATIRRLREDLKDSVKKTRELRAELTDRAAENVRSEVKLREVETELSVAQASTDLIATGVLDYTVAPESVEDEPAAGQVKSSR
jgi:chromosome segregation ATPase